MLDRRYITVVSGFLIQGVMIGGMFTYGIFFTYLEAEFGWSRTLLSACISLSFFMMGAGAIGAGYLSDRFGPRGVMCASGLVYGLGYALMSSVSAPWQLFVFYGLFVGLGLSTHDVVTLSVVARTFDKRRGIMSGIVKVGTATGQIIIPLVVTTLIAWFDWRLAAVALGAGAAFLLVLAGIGLGMGNAAHEKMTRTDAGAARPPTGMTLETARRTRPFWTLCLIQFCFLPALVTIPVHVPVHAVDLGFTPTRAATLLSLVGASSILGRLLIGSASDRIGGRTALMVALGILAASLVLLSSTHGAAILYVFAFFYGIGHGGLFTVVSPIVAEYFGMRAHGAIFGLVLFCGTVGASMGPVTAGNVFDTTGSYSLAFWGLAVLALIGLALAMSLPRPALDR